MYFMFHFNFSVFFCVSVCECKFAEQVKTQNVYAENLRKKIVKEVSAHLQKQSKLDRKYFKNYFKNSGI